MNEEERHEILNATASIKGCLKEIEKELKRIEAYLELKIKMIDEQRINNGSNKKAKPATNIHNG